MTDFAMAVIAALMLLAARAIGFTTGDGIEESMAQLNLRRDSLIQRLKGA